MTEEELLTLLKKRSITARLHGKGVDNLIERDDGFPGLFMPPSRQRKSAIFLRTGRTVRKTLFTLCHELGHFWAYATNRRTDSYELALRRQQVWESAIALKVHNTESILEYAKPSEAPKEVYSKALADAERDKPNPLSEDDRQEILAEEVRAWCFGMKIAKALGVADTDAFCAEANTALGNYYQRLKLPCAEWAPTNCNCNLAVEDERFVLELAAPDAIVTGSAKAED
ncbi:MAG TPA: hypothetical protein VK762_03255 [Polyangiaceae bacterium]|jgi:hypothetical protein|nr:hypothetical protein [Polyangiaceae bacterium]